MVASDARRASRARRTRGALRCNLATVLLNIVNGTGTEAGTGPMACDNMEPFVDKKKSEGWVGPG